MARPSASKASLSKVSTTASPTDSTSASLDLTVNDTASEYDTPGTTPAMSATGRASTKRKRSQLSHAIPDSDDMNGEGEDAALAARLQEEEYRQEGVSNKRAKMGMNSIRDSESDLSEIESFDSDDIPLSSSKKLSARNLGIGKLNNGKAPARLATGSGKSKAMSLPSRTARDSARKSINDALDPTVEDSELSELEDPLSENDGSEDNFEAGDTEGEDEEATGASDAEDEIPLAARRPAKQATAGAAQTTTASPTSVKRRKSRKSRGKKGRRFGNYSAEDVDAIVEEIGSYPDRKTRERKKLEKAHPGIKTMWEDLEKLPVIEPVPAEQPKSINRTLKSFQLEGLDWLIKQEKSTYKGGLLGDEMGMGKTIQAVSLIMSDYPQKQPTLVVVPPVALMQWSTEIQEYTDGKLKVLVYHGQNSKVKKMSVKDLKQYDVIMISYNSLESLHRKETKGWSRKADLVKEDSPIHAIKFHRLILDEAHSIKSRTTGVAKACFALSGTYKWCLSGTPVQNRIGEFFSLLRFLEVRPFADYFCKKCPCAMLHWKLNDDHMCAGCKHAGMEHVSVFNQELLNPLTQSEDAVERSKAMDKLHMITARIMLRRMKRDYTSSMELPPKEVIVHNEFFGEIERDFSSSIMTNTTRQFDTYVSRGVMLNNYANIFGLIMQMRQVANHPDLLLKKHAQEGQNVLVCNICDEVAEEAIRSKCKHDFCRACVKSFVQSAEITSGDPDCPRCHIPLEIDFDQPDIEQDEEVVKKSSIINRIKMENWTSSTKIEMLVYDLYKMRSKKQTLKSIVFSQFTSMLQLIEWRLRRAGFNTVMLDGSMTPIQRQKSIEYFMTNPDVEVFLVSLKAGGVALNLTEASRVFIVDPWWNPAAEWQSADRCHRIGQKRPCVITRLCIEDSVESRMVMLQEKKAQMISGTINNDKVAMEKLTPEDMQFLFRGS
ncbi:hypothetical protein MBLNU230_g2123t1 [Neophaeotheca triangularis]